MNRNEELRNKIADFLWSIDGSDISQSREYYLENADVIIEAVRKEDNQK